MARLLKQKIKKSKRPQRLIWAIAIIVSLFILAGAILWILNSPGSLAAIMGVCFAVLGVIFAFLQVMFAFLSSSDKDKGDGLFAPTFSIQEPNTTTISATPPDTSQVSPPLVPQLPPPDLTGLPSIMGIRPPTHPSMIVQREQTVKKIYEKLVEKKVSSVVLTGMPGLGKSTLAALVCDYAEEKRRKGSKRFAVPVLWLKIDTKVTMVELAETLLQELGKTVPNLNSLDPLVQARTLLEALKTTNKPCLIVLDQFENLLNLQTGKALPNRPGIDELIYALNSQECRCRVLLTSRIQPQGSGACMIELPVHYLNTTEGVELLRKQGVAEPQATEEELRSVVEYCGGHAQALTLLANILKQHKLNLTDPDYAPLWRASIAENLLDPICKKQLSKAQYKLLEAFFIYNEAVPLDAAGSVLKSSAIAVQPSLNALLKQHLLRASGGGKYQLHPIIRDYIRCHLNERNAQTAHTRAAKYYFQEAKHCPSQGKQQRIKDVQSLIKAIWHQCQAKQWKNAYSLIEKEGIFTDLNKWKEYSILVELCQLLLPLENWHQSPVQAANIYSNLGVGYKDLGKKEEAVKYFEQALQIYRKCKDSRNEGTILNNLGIINQELGNKEKALLYFEQALHLQREVGNRVGEAVTLNEIGVFYFNQQIYDVALACYLRAERILQEVQGPYHETQRRIDDLHSMCGKEQFNNLKAYVEPNASQIIELALRTGL